MASKLQLSQFTDRSFADTRQNWEDQAGKAEFASEYSAIFSWADAHRDYDIDPKVGDSLAYGLFAPKSNTACAMVDVVLHKRGRKGVTKLLKVFVTPEYWNVTEHQDQILEIFTSAIAGTIQLSKRVQSGEVKIYGRSEALLSLLHSLHVHLNKNIEKFPGIAAAMKGRWLEITTV